MITVTRTEQFSGYGSTGFKLSLVPVVEKPVVEINRFRKSGIILNEFLDGECAVNVSTITLKSSTKKGKKEVTVACALLSANNPTMHCSLSPPLHFSFLIFIILHSRPVNYSELQRTRQ